MVKALVTGGTGFVGSHLVRELLRQGHSVRVLHRTTSRLDALAGLDYESVIGTVTDYESLLAACDGVDWVFHVAAVADYWRADHSRMYDVNVEGTRKLLKAARETRVSRVVFTSSAAAIGMHADRPADESEPFNLPPRQFPYGHSKSQAEAVVADAVQAGQDVVTVNPVVVMGPGDLNMISGSFITQIKKMGPLVPVTSGGVAVVDVRDVARWQVLAAQHGDSGKRYILSTTNYSYRTLFDMIAQTVGVLRPRFYAPDFIIPAVARVVEMARAVGVPTPIDATQARLGIRKVYFDPSRAWSELGAPQVDMWQSLRDTYEWYLANGYI